MSTTVSYKGSTIATITNQTKTLTTAGKWLEADISITDSSSGDGSAITITDTTDTAGGTIRTITAVDISDTTAVASDVASGKYFYTADGTKTAGSASGGSIVVTDVANTTGTTAAVTGNQITLTTKSITQNGTYNASSDSADGYSSVTVNVSGGTQTTTGTVTGDGTNTLSIPCTFAPNTIYVNGDLSSDPSLRGIVTVEIIKDTSFYITSDGSQSAVQEVLFDAETGISGYNESNTSYPHATYTNNTLTIDTVQNTSQAKFVNGVTYSYKLIGPGNSSPSATQHNIYFEFSDSTNTTIPVYYDDSLIGTMITAYTPTTYGQKTVTLAQLDGVTWYEPSVIPLNTELVNYNTVTADMVLNTSGEEEASQWYGVTDYILIDPSMTFSVKCGRWHNDCFYDSSKTFISYFSPYTAGWSADPNDSNVAVGTIGGSGQTIPSNAMYIRMTTLANPDNTACSLIRTA